jgi:hypothetical protein
METAISLDMQFGFEEALSSPTPGSHHPQFKDFVAGYAAIA